MEARSARPPGGRPEARPIEPPASRWQLPTDGPIDGSDLVAVGADLEPGTLLAAYRTGLFPMPYDRRRIAWFSPDPRGILPLDALHVSRTLRRSVHRFDVTFDTAFTEVVLGCADPARSGAWIDRRIIDAYRNLFDLGWAHSIEIRHRGDDEHQPGELVGGLYGVRVDGLFAGESMFHRVTDASKVALVHTVQWMRDSGGQLFDVQWTTPHLRSLGAIDVPRDDYLARLRHSVGGSADAG